MYLAHISTTMITEVRKTVCSICEDKTVHEKGFSVQIYVSAGRSFGANCCHKHLSECGEKTINRVIESEKIEFMPDCGICGQKA